MNKKNRIVSLAWLSVLVLLLGSKAFSQDITISQDTSWGGGIYTYNNVWVTSGATLTFNGSITLNCTNLDLHHVLS